MDIERFFRFNKYFVFFCALLIAVWLALQFVINERIKVQSGACAVQLFTWSWPGLKVRSTFAGKSVNILKRSDSLVIVEVRGLQKLYRESGAESNQIITPQCDTYTVRAILSFYKMSGNWLLGKVEF